MLDVSQSKTTKNIDAEFSEVSALLSVYEGTDKEPHISFRGRTEPYLRK